MKVLVLNCGSSSIKYKLFDMNSKEVIAQEESKNRFERFIPETDFAQRWEENPWEGYSGTYCRCRVHPEYLGKPGIWRYQITWRDQCRRSSYGTRGERFSKSVLLTKEVLEAFAACNDLAPSTILLTWKELMPLRLFCRMFRKSVYSTLHSTKPCRNMHTCMLFLMNCTKVRCTSLWFPRNFPSLRFTARVRISGD